MQVPKYILQKQLCSECHMYLSVSPVKVYPNREVRCGRCTKENDNGVESLLYLTVVKDMLFPCLNGLEGCEEQLTMSEMKQHEGNCKGSKYECPICENFKGESHLLIKHCEIYHKKQKLQTMAFHLNLAKGNQQCWYFYIKDDIFLFVDIIYDEDLQEIMIDVLLPAEKYKGDILHVFKLSSVEDKTIFKTTEIFCSKLNSSQRYGGVNIHTSNLKFPSNIAYCQFDLKRSLHLNHKLLVIDPALYSFIVRCTFKNISKMFVGKPQYFPAVYYFCDIPWKVCLVLDEDKYIAVYLQWLKIENYDDTQEAAYGSLLDVMFTLLSPDNLAKQYSKIKYNLKYIEGKQSEMTFLRRLSDLLQPHNGYLKNDEINIEIKVNIHPSDNKKGKCNKMCLEHCKC